MIEKRHYFDFQSLFAVCSQRVVSVQPTYRDNALGVLLKGFDAMHGTRIDNTG